MNGDAWHPMASCWRRLQQTSPPMYVCVPVVTSVPEQVGLGYSSVCAFMFPIISRALLPFCTNWRFASLNSHTVSGDGTTSAQNASEFAFTLKMRPASGLLREF